MMMKKENVLENIENPETSYRDHSVFLESRDRYNFLFKLKKDNI